MIHSSQQKQEELVIIGESFLQSTVLSYTKILYNFIRRFGFSNEDTEDILQDIFIKIWKYKDSFDKEKSSLKTWIFTITKNTIYDALRKKKRVENIRSIDEQSSNENKEEAEDVSLSILHLLERLETKTKLLEAIETLNENEKSIFFLHTEESLTFNEIATIFDSPLNTIKSIYRRSLLKLQIQLQEMHQNKN